MPLPSVVHQICFKLFDKWNCSTIESHSLTQYVIMWMAVSAMESYSPLSFASAQHFSPHPLAESNKLMLFHLAGIPSRQLSYALHHTSLQPDCVSSDIHDLIGHVWVVGYIHCTFVEHCTSERWFIRRKPKTIKMFWQQTQISFFLCRCHSSAQRL